jgi:hypothetical protein
MSTVQASAGNSQANYLTDARQADARATDWSFAGPKDLSVARASA